MQTSKNHSKPEEMQQWNDTAKKKKAKTKKENWKLKISDMLAMKTNKVDKTTKTSFTAAPEKASGL